METNGARKVQYSKARILLLIVGLVVLLVVAGVMQLRSVDPSEQAAILLFIPVFIGFLFWGVGGGVAAALLATAGYVAIKWGSIQIVGLRDFLPFVMSRSLAYLLFGIVGGWATSQLEASLNKLELYDQIDDTTGLYNARFFLQDTDLEMSRSRRYRTIFSIALLQVPRAGLDSLSGRQRAGLLKELARIVTGSVRTVDRVIYAADQDVHLMSVLLPETGREGAEIFTARLHQGVAEHLRHRGAGVSKGEVRSEVLTFPDDEQAIDDLRRRFAHIDRTEHPEDVPDHVPPAKGHAEPTGES